jgi:hypothetical protein
LKNITFGDFFNKPLDILQDLVLLTELNLGREYSLSLSLSKNLTKLTFPPYRANFNNPLDFSNCKNISVVKLGYGYNQNIDHFPDTITHLTLGKSFDKSMKKLPKAIKEFTAGKLTDVNIEYLPQSIEKLELGELNKEIICVSSNLKELKIYSYGADLFLGNNNTIKKLHLGNMCYLSCMLPITNLIYLKINVYDPKKVVGLTIPALTKNLKIFKFTSSYDVLIYDKLPKNIIYMDIFNKKSKIIFPINLKKLKIRQYPEPLDNLPNGLTHLKIFYWCNYNFPLDNLPPSLTHLYLNDNFNQPVDKLPESLIYLCTGTSFNQSLDNLPPTLKYLYLLDKFNKSINNIPDSIENLIITNKLYNVPILKLPMHLKILQIIINPNIYSESLRPGIKVSNVFTWEKISWSIKYNYYD